VFPETPAERGYEPGDVIRDCDDCPQMVVVPAGSFTMGSPAGEEGRLDIEGPQHRVTIAGPFAVGRFEVTRTQFETFVRETSHDTGNSCWTYAGGDWKERARHSWRNPGFSQGADHPVTCVTWDDAKAYVAWLGRRTGEDYRLLSEAEWEYAARAGTTTRFSFGDRDADLCDHGNHADRATTFSWKNAACSDGMGEWTAEVGSFAANAFGLHDLHGNVWEWVEDCQNDSYARAPDDGSAWTSGDCGQRVLRGGSWVDRPGNLRSAIRGWFNPELRRISHNGFRVARTLTP
jgi:formylglycine-generating enzyme required for sulfatase activity